ncbi:16S rRNA (cytosine(967)-C(5))-methyltransferase RsmB [Bacillus solimangrovi]|uniref:16S rRNA (cytosine(967)-C(5))-methyltransferase n=1 Tax=Bacillus solimangrovi TaxID=1305675 RepID=A0A1E5LAW9_9BACI|nr:16S rRNA (cytosine(967)-C(5))-methyltransferase RsmB [Bacillus solimangrovi]OEH91213.1 16S rRNA (cytosine(967)-C(5))-methyltransferase [Bacillus solimangrovi]
MKNNVRSVCLDILDKIEKNQSYSNLLLNQAIEKSRLNSKDAALLTEIVYGTIQRKLTLDYYLSPFLTKAKKLQPWVRQLLRLSLYQMVYLDRVPERAVIHEAVEIAKHKGHRGISGMVNGVLRNIQRTGIADPEKISDPIERISIATSHPKWLVEKWVQQYGEEITRDMCEQNLLPPSNTARVNIQKATVSEVLTMLKQAGIEAEKGLLSEDAIVIKSGNVAKTTAFKEGYLSIQDESSMLVARALDIKPGQTVLDACAAPGGKTAHIAERLLGVGSVMSVDLHDHKVKLIAQQVHRLGLDNVNAMQGDSRKLHEKFGPESFERVLVDAPCSGFGVMRRKPDLKYAKTAEDVQRLANIQLDILEAASQTVKKGGLLVYSTCTIDLEENDQVISTFLRKHAEFELDTTLSSRMPAVLREHCESGKIQILSHEYDSDGFFIATLRKKV